MGQNLITGYQGADRQIFTQQVYRNNFATPPINLQNIDSGAVEMNYIAPGDTIAKTYFHFINGSQGNAANSHLAYDPVLDVWTTKALNPTVRTGIAFVGTSAKDKLY
jgi:hypothetical protein